MYLRDTLTDMFEEGTSSVLAGERIQQLVRRQRKHLRNNII